jgi:hypothetical protein
MNVGVAVAAGTRVGGGVATTAVGGTGLGRLAAAGTALTSTPTASGVWVGDRGAAPAWQPISRPPHATMAARPTRTGLIVAYGCRRTVEMPHYPEDKC